MKKYILRFTSRWVNYYRKSSIQFILSMSFTAVAVLGMLFLGISLFFRFSSSTNEQFAYSSQLVLSQVNHNLDSYLRGMMRVSDSVYYSIIKDYDISATDIASDLSLIYETGSDSLVSIAVYKEDGTLVASAPLSQKKESVSPEHQAWFKKALGKTENLHFSTPHVQNLFSDPDYRYRWVVSLSRYVALTESSSTQSGVLLVDMNFSGIEQICKNVALPGSGYLYLIDSDGELIYHPHQQLIYAGLAKENNLVASQLPDGTTTEIFSGSRRQITVKTVGYTGWKLVGVVPRAGLWDNLRQILLFFLFIVFFSAFSMVFINRYLSERISKPIKALENSVKALEAGNLDIEFMQGGPYEIIYLSESIQSMVITLRKLMEDIVKQEEFKRRSELDVLQSQINPHFLYNTLDSVVWMTENGRTEEAVILLTSLARFFRISLSRGNVIIPLKDELEHAKQYLTIQKMRYKNKFTDELIAENDVLNLSTIKLIVQPILENAIYHGMAYSDGDGLIRIHAYVLSDRLYIDVIDNGPGMPEKTVSNLLNPNYTPPADTNKKHSGIALRNVHQRIQLTYGKQYGLTIQSEPDVGTTVSIILPAIPNEQINDTK